MKTIQQKIVSWSVVSPDDPQKPVVLPVLLERAEVLSGSTYKLKTPMSEHALYITMNNMEIDGQLRPFEIFINSKSMEHFQWVVALTRILSAVFRHGGEVNFLIDELKSVFDPKGGAFHRGHYVPSLVAAIGEVVERHLESLGLYVKDTSLQAAAVAMIEEKTKSKSEKLDNPKGLCPKCGASSVVIMDGCGVCLECGDSKCS